MRWNTGPLIRSQMFQGTGEALMNKLAKLGTVLIALALAATVTGAPLHNPKPGTFNSVGLDQVIALHTKQCVEMWRGSRNTIRTPN